MKKSFGLLVALVFLSQPIFAHDSNFSVGYRDGFYFKTDDGNFLLKLGSRLNTLYSFGKLENESNISSFDLKHAKVYFGGHAFNESVQYYAQGALAGHTRTNNFGLEHEDNIFALEDYYIRGNYGDVALQLGQFKVPFSKQYMVYSGNLQFVTRSIASNAFQFGRDRGINLTGKKPWLSYMLGLYNGGSVMQQPRGLGSLNDAMNTSNDAQSTGFTYLARLSLFPIQPVGYGESDVAFSEQSKFEIGTSLAIDQSRDYDTKGDLLADEFDVNTFSVSTDLAYMTKGFSFQGEFYYRYHRYQNIATSGAWGAYVQAGYFLTPRTFEIAARYALVEPDTNVSSDFDQEISATLNYYLSKDHKRKMQLQYSRIHQADLNKTDHWVHWMMQLTI